MSPFRKAKAEQAAIKMGLYGATGSGKTFTALLCADGLARLTGKRIAYIDTERGTDFYIKANPKRKVHPDAFDFDAIYTRRISEVLDAVRSLDPEVHGIVVLDSITHIWEAALLAYQGKTTSIGSIPFHAWGPIKKPYREILNLLMSSPCHFFICARQGNEFRKDETTGDLEVVGTKMKAEGETAYEPHTLIHMEAIKPSLKVGGGKYADAVITAYGEKDRTSMLAGKVIEWPNYNTLIEPILPLLGISQAQIETDDDRSVGDAEAFDTQDDTKGRESADVLRQYRGRFEAANTLDEVEAIGRELTVKRKKVFTPADLKACRDAYSKAKERTAATKTTTPKPPQAAPPEKDDQPIGPASDLFGKIRDAFHTMSPNGQVRVLKQLGVDKLTEVAKLNQHDAGDALIAIQDAAKS